MTEFDGLRDQLTNQRRQLEQLRQEALLAREAVRQAERALKIFDRGADPHRENERSRLEANLKSAQARAERAAGALDELRASEGRTWGQFADFSDPRKELRRLSDRYPILLMPLRLETRFKTGENGQPQLWVRVFPDACLVDTFEEALTEQEVLNAQVFWASIWRAGGDDAGQRAAWRELAAAHGSGRAGWIVRSYLPLNPGDQKVKDNPSDVLLIIIANGPLPSAVPLYWEAYWRAVGPGGAIDVPARDAAYAALEAAVGTAQARELSESTRPFNINDAPEPPRTRAGVQVKALVMQVTPPGDLSTRRSSWSSAPRVDLLPERFVLVGTWTDAAGAEGAPLVAVGSPIHTPLIAGPDPNAPPAEQLKPVGDMLQIPEAMAWMFNFERAVEVGMALRIDLNPQQAAVGFKRIVVLGVRMADSPEEGQRNLTRLLEHHLHSRSGLELLPQGTPTNNTEKSGAGYSFRDDPEISYSAFFLQQPQYAYEADPLLRRDGQWLAQHLGLPDAFARRIPNAGGRDQLEARAMQIALWHGSLGYMMDSLLTPVFSDQDVAATRSFFTRYVSGRGPLPALRIGNQPYGILPTTAFDRVNWFGGEPREGAPRSYLGKLYRVLRHIEDDWRTLVDRVSYLGKQGAGDPQQNLLDVLGLHPGSVEYYPLQADSLSHKFYELAFLDFSISLNLLGLFPAVLPITLLRSFGYAGAEVPELLNKIYHARQTPLDGPLIDDRPLSEREGIRKYAGNLNYIQWLVEAAQAGIERVQQEQGFDGGNKPAALLYLMLRHALQLGFYITGVRLQADAGMIDDTRAMMRDAPFVHITEPVNGAVRAMARGSESRYELLFQPADEITGQTDLRLGDYIAANIRIVNPDLREHLEALERLSGTPTARLERVFAEHIDTVSYRLDAWRTGLMAWQLEQMRSLKRPDDPAPERAGAANQAGGGLFLGAYGWVEPLLPEGKTLTPVELDDALDGEVNKPGDPPLMRDSTNQGLVHTPSLNHAATAAVLRNGYIANDGRLAVDLSSRRVRHALAIIEGMRGGQSLGALLGYQFERHVHDNGPLQVRDLIYPLRRAFPLAANQINKTDTEDGEAQESIAAMNVVDGRKLIEYVEGRNNFTYPFDRADLPRRAADQEAAITAALAHIRDINDALADLVLAEGVHQAVLGNFDRSAGTLDAFAKGGYPPEMEVVRTPRSGIALTLRAAIHLPVGALAAPMTPLGEAEPALNHWLRDRLPDPDRVGCQVTFTDRATDATATELITQTNLGLDAIDLLYRAETGASQALSDLDDRILHYLHSNFAPRHDRPIEILYTRRIANRVTWFELQALLRSLRTMTVAARPLQPADLQRSGDAAPDDQARVTLEKSRIETALNALSTGGMNDLNALTTALADPTVTIDATLAQFAGTVGGLAAYRLPQTGIGFVYEWRTASYTALVEKAAKRIQRWTERRAQYTARMDAYGMLDPSTPAPERIALLQQAEVILSPSLTLPAPPTPAAYLTALGLKENAFDAKLSALQDLVTAPRPALADLLVDANVLLPLTDFDLEPFDFADTQSEINRFRASLTAAVDQIRKDLSQRLAKVNALLVQHGTSAAAEQVRLLQEAGKVLLGDDFVMVPQIRLPARAAEELANAWQHSASGKLTAYLTGDPTGTPPGAGRDFPVDDWLHGVARVREKMHHWENALFLGEALPGAQPPELTPLQLPYGAEEPWLALEIPPGYTIDSDRLLYTAHFSQAFDPTQPVCGLLVDEWSEVIPGVDETTGVAFHFDRPNAEPPQAWLLALPALMDGAWSWEELLGAVNSALDEAKMRALEPVHIDSTPYSAFLPATFSAYTFPEISISNNLLRNVQIYAKLLEK